MNMLRKALLPLVLLAWLPQLQAADNSLFDHPGFVDFSRLTTLAGSEPIVEISLKAPLLNMVTNLIRSEDEQAADFISKLNRVTVNVFESEDVDVSEMAETMAEIASDLESEGWETVVRVREDDEHVDIYVRMSADGELIHGIAIMVAERQETVLVNIVGDISGNDLAALGRRFDIEELQELEVEVEVN